MSPRTSSARISKNGQSPSTVPTVRTMAMASPPPLPPTATLPLPPPADITGDQMSITGLLSPNHPAINLTNELSEVMDMNSFFDELENEVFGTSPDRQLGQQVLTTASAAQQGTIDNYLNNPGARLTQTVPSAPIPDLLSARTQNAQTAMVQAATHDLHPNGPAMSYGPAMPMVPHGPAASSSKGPYFSRNPEQEREIEKLQQQLDFANENANRNLELMRSQWNEQQLKFKQT